MNDGVRIDKLKLEYTYAGWVYLGGSNIPTNRQVLFPLFQCPRLNGGGKNCCARINEQAIASLTAVEGAVPKQHAAGTWWDTYLLVRLSFRREVDGQLFTDWIPVVVQRDGDGLHCWDFRERLPDLPQRALDLMNWPRE